MNREYIEIEILYRQEVDEQLENLGINLNKGDDITFDQYPGVIFKDSIDAFNPSEYKGVTTIHTALGSLLVKGDYNFIKALILE